MSVLFGFVRKQSRVGEERGIAVRLEGERVLFEAGCTLHAHI